MKDCIFCGISAGTIPANILYQDDNILVFDDINPQAPYHKIIIPRTHISSLNDVNPDNATVVGEMVKTAANIAKNLKIANEGYRVVFNCNAHGGQTVFHIHAHLLGGRQMIWPPG